MKRILSSAIVLALSAQAANAGDAQSAATAEQPAAPAASGTAANVESPATKQQEVAAQQQAAAKLASSQQLAALATGGTAAGSSLQSLASPFLAAINSDEKTATISGKFDLGGDSWGKFLTVTAQTPVAQGSDFTNAATLDGLTSSSSVEFRFSLLGGGPAGHARIQKAGPVTTPADETVITFDGKVGSQDHQYYDPATLLQHTSHTVSWQAGASLGRIFADGHVSLNLNFDYQEFYQDGDTGQTRTQCLVADNCVTGFIGAPVLTHSGLLSGDLRWIDKIGLGAKQYPIGAELKVTYDPIRDAEAVQVPIYFATDNNGALTGGVRYDWQSDRHVSTIGVFVSSAFNLGSLDL